MITVYGHPFSGNSRKVTWALTEMGHPHEFKLVDLMKGAQRAVDFLAINPLARVPAVVFEGGETLTESNAILLTLATRYESPLKTHDPKVTQWLFWQATDCAPIAEAWYMKVLVPAAQFNAAAYDAAVAKARRVLTSLEAHLSGREWLTDAFSVADIAVVESLGLCAGGGIDLDAFPSVAAYLARASARPGFQQSRPGA
jgi:glutathione S-transferase